MRRLMIAAALAGAALLLPAGAASARILPGHGAPWVFAPLPVTATAYTQVSDDPDNGHGTPPEWAVDAFWRQVTVTRGASVPAADCGLVSGSCWAYSATLGDSGTFTTIPGAGTPNQSCAGCGGLHVKSPALRGSLSGAYKITFCASSGTPDASLVPWFHDDHGAAASAPFTSTSWPELFFPAGTSFGGLAGGAYEWDYEAITRSWPYTTQRWADSSSNGDGNQPGDGNIAG